MEGCGLEKKPGTWREALLVTVAGLSAMVFAFILYALLFALFETFANQDGTYASVSWIRLANGIVWILACLALYRTRIPEWLKAGMLAGALAAFMAGTGVRQYETPWIALAIDLAAVGTAVLLLLAMKKKWYQYHAVAMAIVASVVYSGALS